MRLKQLISSLMVGAAAVMAFSSAAHAADMTGAGATFPYPIYAKWAESYKAATGNGLNYQSVGSGAGIKQIKAKTVDFGASDMPLSAADLDAEGLMQFPAIMGGVVTVVNLDGITPGQLKLTGPVVADIYLGKVTKWNDAAIKAAFRRDMAGEDFSGWLYNSADNAFGVRDLGYYVGYAITRGYYNRASDKAAALKTMIELDYSDPAAVQAFVDASGYLVD